MPNAKSRADALRPCLSEEVVMDLSVVLRRLLREDSGQDLMEYGLLAALIAIAAVSALTTTGSSFNQFWTSVATSLAAIA